MGIFLKRTVNNSSIIGVWDITESVDVLLSQIKLNKEEQERYDCFGNDLRRLHWLSYRNLLKELIPPEEYSHVIYDDCGKPYMENNLHFLSVAHSGKFSAAIVSKRKQVGIDIEMIHPKIEKVVSKFLSETEKEQITEKDRLEQLFIHWAAKEALYKLYGRKELDFKVNMFINPFSYAEKGELIAAIKNEEMDRNFNLHYEKIENYMMVYMTE